LAKTADPQHTETLSRNDEQCALASGDTKVLSQENCKECKLPEERTEFLEQQKAAKAAEEAKAVADENEKHLLQRLKVNLMRLEVIKDDPSMTAEEKEELEKEYQTEKATYEAERGMMLLNKYDTELEQMAAGKKEKLRRHQEKLRLEAEAKGWEDVSDAVSGLESETEKEAEGEDEEEYTIDTLEEYFEELRISDKGSLDMVQEAWRLEAGERIWQVQSPSPGWRAKSTSPSS
jgi:hypothetical protein